MNPANLKRGIWAQLQNQNKTTYHHGDLTLDKLKDAIGGLFYGKKKKPTRRKQTVKKVNGQTANKRFFARTW